MSPFARSGSIGGMISAVVFMGVHQLTIVGIWFSAVPMVLAGAVCGTLIAWSYGRLTRRATVAGWLGYNLTYVVMFVALSVASLLAFEPVATVPELMAANGPPDALFGQALPVTLACVPISAAAITLGFGRWRELPAVLVTVSVLVLLLGLNVSVTGLVEFQASEIVLLLELLGLIALLASVFAVAVVVLERDGAFRPPRAPMQKGS